MRSLILTICAVALIVSVAALAGDDAEPWFDLENCAFCKHIGAEEGLVDHMHSEYHNLKGGILFIMTIDPQYKEAFDRAQAAMNEVGIEMQKTGEVPHMCRHCRMYGEFMTSGVAIECVEAEVGSICMMTSEKPEMVEKLQAFGARTAEETAKFHASRQKK